MNHEARPGMHFADRFDAGRQLAAVLGVYRSRSPIVVGVARGGVPVAFAVARTLGAPLEVWVAQRIGSPTDPDVTIGAISEGGAVSLDQELVTRLALPELVVALQVVRAAAEVDRQARVMRGGPPIDVRGRLVILVDDGVATGATIRAAAASVRARGPRELVLAVPVGALEVVQDLGRGFDRTICMAAKPMLHAIDSRYGDGWSVTEADVASLMTEHERERGFDLDEGGEPAHSA
jgi:putative phosphoribosyl transferase